MTGFSYDDVPYESHSYSFTHPRFLYTVARLFCLDPADFRQARILELGCAAGGNIIPIAYNLPQCRILGIDSSAKEIEVGRAQIGELGLSNIQLTRGSILDIEPSLGQFDYIICHGVYSWVPEAVKRKILAVCRDNLAENGVAIISYNTLPGWNSAMTVRDLMIYHAEGYEDPEEQANQARCIVDFIYEGIKSKDTHYSQFLKTELEILSGYTNHQLLHDHLEKINRPLYFYQFIEELGGFGLRYLGDAPLANMYHRNLPESLALKLDKLGDVIRIGQYMDFIYNQRFRCTLICHDTDRIRQTLCRKLKPDMMREFYFSLDEAIDEEVIMANLEDGQEVEVALKKRRFKFDDKLSKISLLVLAGERGKPLSFGGLVEKVMQRGQLQAPKPIEEFLIFRFSLPELVLSGILDIYPCKIEFTTQIKKKPLVSALARMQARSSTMVTSRLHHAVELSVEQRILLQYCNGKYTEEEILEKMTAHFMNKELTLQREDETAVEDEQEIRKQIKKLYTRGMQTFAAKALLL